MPIKLKQMSDDALVTIQVNKNYYEMVKGLSFYLFTLIKVDDKHVYLKEIIDKKPEELDDLQRAFYTVTLLIAEIEQQAKANNLIVEKEVLQPGDEGYVNPLEPTTQD